MPGAGAGPARGPWLAERPQATVLRGVPGAALSGSPRVLLYCPIYCLFCDE